MFVVVVINKGLVVDDVGVVEVVWAVTVGDVTAIEVLDNVVLMPSVVVERAIVEEV